MLEICLRLNIKCVSAYAFAIDNFKRSEEEVAALMRLAEEKLTELCKHGYVRSAIKNHFMSSSCTETYWMNMACAWISSVIQNSYPSLCKKQFGKRKIWRVIINGRYIWPLIGPAQNWCLITSAILNLCMPYASRDEVTTAIKSSVQDSLATNQYEVSYVATPFWLGHFNIWP